MKGYLRLESSNADRYYPLGKTLVFVLEGTKRIFPINHKLQLFSSFFQFSVMRVFQFYLEADCKFII
jgi:hypothetical protein